MKTKIYLLLLLFSITLQLWGKDNTPYYLNQVKVNNAIAVNKRTTSEISMELDLTHLRLKSQHTLKLKPLLISQDKKNKIELPVLIVNGKRKEKVYARTLVLGKTDLVTEEVYKKINSNEIDNKIDYTQSIPLESWMNTAYLALQEEVTGCAECGIAQNTQELIQLKPQFIPNFQLIYIVPEAEIKTRSDQHTASLNFKIDQSEIIRNYRQNSGILTATDSIINEVRNNKDITITEFIVEGYASPEASFQHNLKLSQARANSFAEYIATTHQFDVNSLKVTGHGEDWNLLKAMIERSFLEKKTELLSIIENTPNPDARDSKIKQLDANKTYKRLLEIYYPSLRRIEYTIAYTIRSFNLEEIQDRIKNNPKLLSLNEMYLLAKTYNPKSEEFDKVFSIASHIYPNDPVALLNAAAAKIEIEDYDWAITQLEKLSTTPEAWNNLGVAYAKMGNYEKAASFFLKAKEKGIAEANHNIEQLNRFTK